MTVCEIWDISPLLFLINFVITLADSQGDLKIYKKYFNWYIQNQPHSHAIITTNTTKFLLYL